MRFLTVSDLRSIEHTVIDQRARYVLSLLDPGEQAVPKLDLPSERHTVLRVHDVEDRADPHAPNARLIADIVAFGERIPDGARVIVHCSAGISRSPAAALILHAVWGQPLTLDINHALPNQLMLTLGEAALGAPLIAAGAAQERVTDRYLIGRGDWIDPR